MFKRLSDRAEKAIRRVLRSSALEPPKVELRYTDWEGLKALVVLLNQSPGPFEPLASVINQLSAYVEKYDAQARTLPLYAQLSTDLDELCFHIAKYVNSKMQVPISPESITSLTYSLTHEVRSLPDEAEGGMEREQASTAMNINLLVKGYRRIQKLLALFLMSENPVLWKIKVDKIEAIKLGMLPHAPEAHYSYVGPGAVPRNGCMHNTRVAVLQELRDWVHYGRSQNILWLNGTAGTGKTTIAYSLCELLENSGRLSANFFCSRIHPSCREVKQIVPSIVHQLALQSRPFRCALSHALSQDPGVFERPVDEQSEILMYIPLQKVAHTFNADPVIVIDALDQCNDIEAVYRTLDAILKHAPGLPVRFLIVSYPAPGIRSRMRGSRSSLSQPELCLHQQDKSVVQQDIKTYITARLQPMTLPASDLDHLLLRSGVLFVYAAAIVNYISSGDGLERTEWLRHLLKLPFPRVGSQNLDAAYAAMLERTLYVERPDSEENGEIRLVLYALASTKERASVNAIAGLLRLDLVRLMRSSFRWLLPALRVSPTDGQAICFDEEFITYLARILHSSGELREDSQNHLWLAHACFDVIRSVNPPFNICSLESSYLGDKELPFFAERVDDIILPELLYACRSWGTHTSLAGQDDNLTRDLEDFFSTRLLLWMEVLNLRDCMKQGVETLLTTRSWVQEEKYPTALRTLIEDAYEFVHAFSSSIASNSTPHIYISQLQLWPQSKMIYKYYGYRLKRFTNVCHAGHTDIVWSVAYSSDGAYIASGSSDNTIRIWDARTGKSVGRRLTGHRSTVQSVAYSPDGAYIASGSEDDTIRIWDAHTGKLVGQPLTGHTDKVWSIAYSPDGVYIASGSWDKIIRIWDAHTGKPLGQPLTGHAGFVYAVAYSPDGACIASGSSEDTIQIWDARTAKPVGHPLLGHTGGVNLAVYSPDGLYITSGSHDNTIRIWDARTGKPVGQPLIGHTGDVNSVAYSPDGAYIASGSDDNTIRIWDARTGESVGRPLIGHTSWVVSQSQTITRGTTKLSENGSAGCVGIHRASANLNLHTRMSECTEICDGLATRRKWFTADGFDELDRIAKAELDIDLHKWQREGTARILDGIDVILTIATGSGKSTLFQLYALARPEQIVLVISPLKLLQRNMVFSIDKKKNLNALAINADTISAARSSSHNIWSECANGKDQIILCAPEQLDHEKMKALLENSNAFRRRLGLVVVDEAHLIPLWGGDGSSVAFRSAFFTIGNLRSLLRSETVYLALSATLMPGKPTAAVKACLGFREPNFKLMREDCERNSLHFIFRRIIARAPARTFPMLDWLIAVGISKATDILKAVVYVDSVMRGHWIVVYLRSLLPASLQPQAHLIIRHIHASTCPQCKAEAADEFLKDSDLSLLRIVVATEAFGCGIDIRDIRRVVNYGIPHNIHVLLQRFGRNARDGEEAYCYCYVNAKYWDSIAKELGLIPAAEPKTQEAGEDDAVDEEDQRKPADYCPYFKQLLETHLQEKCITRRINILYENTLDGKPAQCMRCSGCVKDQIPSARPAVKPARRRQGNNQTEGIPRLSLSGLRRAYKKDFDEVQKQILNAAHRTWASVSPSKSNQFGGVFAFLPNAKAFTLSRQILDLETVELVQRALGKNWKFWDTHGEIFATRILRIRTTFITDLRTSQLQESPGDSDAESEDQDISQPAEEQATHTPILLAPRPSRLGKRKASEHDIET